MYGAMRIPWPGWEITQLIGRGSFGAVYEMRRKIMDEVEYAALKVISIPQSPNDIEEMRSDGYDDNGIVASFQEQLRGIVSEYTMMRKLSDCPNIVKCDDLQYIPHDDGFGWDVSIKMELLTPLTKVLTDPVPEQMVVKLAKDLCFALTKCKENNIVHRDIKPQNIFISSRGDYKLGDFGIAKTVERTSGGTKIGTYKYIAPEVYNNQPYGSAADIYSLGLVLYWLLNERRMPFLPLPPVMLKAGQDEQSRQRRLSGEPLPVPAHGSEALKRIVLKACAYDTQERYASAVEMLADLNKLDGGEPVSATVATAAPEEFSQEEDVTDPALHRNDTVVTDAVMADSTALDGGEFTSQAAYSEQPVATKEKRYRKWLAIVLAIFPYTGLFGVHDFYLGKKKWAKWKLCTINFIGCGWLWDIIVVLCGRYKDANGEYLH